MAKKKFPPLETIIKQNTTILTQNEQMLTLLGRINQRLGEDTGDIEEGIASLLNQSASANTMLRELLGKPTEPLGVLYDDDEEHDPENNVLFCSSFGEYEKDNPECETCGIKGLCLEKFESDIRLAVEKAGKKPKKKGTETLTTIAPGPLSRRFEEIIELYKTYDVKMFLGNHRRGYTPLHIQAVNGGNLEIPIHLRMYDTKFNPDTGHFAITLGKESISAKGKPRLLTEAAKNKYVTGISKELKALRGILIAGEVFYGSATVNSSNTRITFNLKKDRLTKIFNKIFGDDVLLEKMMGKNRNSWKKAKKKVLEENGK